MPRFHLALEVTNLTESIADYSEKLQSEPCLIIADNYALWRTATLNFSITQAKKSGFKHVGWEDDQASDFNSSKDVNSIVWERFNFQSQLQAIKQKWPDAETDDLAKMHTNLEAKLIQLEGLVEKMQGQLPIDESLAVYEHGTKLAVECEQALSTSEQKVRLLTDRQGTTVAFNPEDENN